VLYPPSFPGHNSPASASPLATSGRSAKASNGWKPKVFFQVAAAFSFWPLAMVIVASKSIRSSQRGSGAAPAALISYKRRWRTKLGETNGDCGPDSVRDKDRRAVSLNLVRRRSALLSG